MAKKKKKAQKSNFPEKPFNQLYLASLLLVIPTVFMIEDYL